MVKPVQMVYGSTVNREVSNQLSKYPGATCDYKVSVWQEVHEIRLRFRMCRGPRVW